MSERDESDAVELPAVDDPPKTGRWVDHEDWFEGLSEDDYAEGNRLGSAIDPDDDDDNGGVG